jgi:hypothetical protein
LKDARCASLHIPGKDGVQVLLSDGDEAVDGGVRGAGCVEHAMGGVKTRKV